jgi:signal transduction histidine kinase
VRAVWWRAGGRNVRDDGETAAAAAGEHVQGAAGADAAVSLRSRLRSMFGVATSAVARQRDRTEMLKLVDAFSQVASAVTSQQSVDEVLRTVVDEAKRVSDTDKVVLAFADSSAQDRVLEPTVVVRGSRSQYPEEWWRSQIDSVAATVLATAQPRLINTPDAWLLCVPVMMKDKAIGVLTAINPHDRPFSEDKADLFRVLGAFAGTTIENARLIEHSRYALLASERDRISREMHDGLSQSLFSISLGIEVCRKRVFRDPAWVDQRLGELQDELSSGRAELRRYIYDLRPVRLRELGLPGAIEVWARELTGTAGPRTSVVISGTQRTLPSPVESCLYRVAREAVTNAVKHANADTVTVALVYAADGVGLMVRDDGTGFDVRVAVARADRGDTVGLRSMQDLVRGEGGTLRVEGGAAGGTTIDVWIPL